MAAAATYRRLGQRDASMSSDSLENNFTRSRSERLMDKLMAVAWIVLALCVARWTSFYTTIWSGGEANRGLLRLGFLGLGINSALLIYLVVYLPRIKGLVDSSAWSVYCPRVIPTMTGVSVGTIFIFIRATWPVWGFLSPLILGTQFMGALMTLHFVPSYPLSNVC